MRDIGRRIGRYRLSRFGESRAPLLRRLRWALPLLGLWLVYAVFVSEHSFLRLWFMDRERAAVDGDLARSREELAELERQARDPAAKRRHAEQTLRERSGFARQGEIIYRIPPAGADSLGR